MLHMHIIYITCGLWRTYSDSIIVTDIKQVESYYSSSKPHLFLIYVIQLMFSLVYKLEESSNTPSLIHNLHKAPSIDLGKLNKSFRFLYGQSRFLAMEFSNSIYVLWSWLPLGAHCLCFSHSFLLF